MAGEGSAGGGEPPPAPPPFFAIPPAQGGRIRAARPADAAGLLALMLALNREQGDPDDRLTESRVARDILGDVAAIAMVAQTADGALAGYALAYPSYETGFAERGLYVADLYTGPAYRRQGVARALLSAVARAGHARGVRHLWLTARTANRAAHAFYRRLGGRGEAVVAFAVVEQDFNNLAAEQPR